MDSHPFHQAFGTVNKNHLHSWKVLNTIRFVRVMLRFKKKREKENEKKSKSTWNRLMASQPLDPKPTSDELLVINIQIWGEGMMLDQNSP